MRSMNALGFIEMYGLVGCIEAADAMVKTASVELIQYSEISAGMVTIVVEGDVASCQAAVNAGVAAGSRLGTVIAHMVIPRPTSDTANMILNLLPQARSDYQNNFGGGSGGNNPPSTPPSTPVKNNNSVAKETTQATTLLKRSDINTQIIVKDDKKNTNKDKKTEKVEKPTSTMPPEVIIIDPKGKATKVTEVKKESKPKDIDSAKDKKSDAKKVVLSENKTLKDQPVTTEKKVTETKNKQNTKAELAIKPKSGVASVLAQFVQATEGKPFSEEELTKTIQYITAHKKGYTWKEVARHFPQHSNELQKKLDEAVASGKLKKAGPRYCKPE